MVSASVPILSSVKVGLCCLVHHLIHNSALCLVYKKWSAVICLVNYCKQTIRQDKENERKRTGPMWIWKGHWLLYLQILNGVLVDQFCGGEATAICNVCQFPWQILPLWPVSGYQLGIPEHSPGTRHTALALVGASKTFPEHLESREGPSPLWFSLSPSVEWREDLWFPHSLSALVVWGHMWYLSLFCPSTRLGWWHEGTGRWRTAPQEETVRAQTSTQSPHTGSLFTLLRKVSQCLPNGCFSCPVEGVSPWLPTKIQSYPPDFKSQTSVGFGKLKIEHPVTMCWTGVGRLTGSVFEKDK